MPSPRNKPVKKRLFRLIVICAAFLAGGCAYAIFVRSTGLAIPCLFYRLTGLKCPGCGITRMALCLMRLDFAGAWRQNPAILCLLPVGAAVAADMAARYVRSGVRVPHKWANFAIWGMIVVLVVFGVMRNLLEL